METTSRNLLPRRTINKIALVALLAVAAFYLWTEHRAHLLGAMPFLIFLLCPLLHLFLHRGHGAHAASGDEVEQSSVPPPSVPQPKPPISSTR